MPPKRLKPWICQIHCGTTIRNTNNTSTIILYVKKLRTTKWSQKIVFLFKKCSRGNNFCKFCTLLQLFNYCDDEAFLASFGEDALVFTGDFFTNCAIIFFMPAETSSFILGISFFPFALEAEPSVSHFVLVAFFFGFGFCADFVFAVVLFFLEADPGDLAFLVFATFFVFAFAFVFVDLLFPLGADFPFPLGGVFGF